MSGDITPIKNHSDGSVYMKNRTSRLLLVCFFLFLSSKPLKTIRK